MGIEGIHCKHDSNERKWRLVYKVQEKRLMWLAFIVAGIMLLSFIGKFF